MKQIYYAIQNIVRGKSSTIIKVVSLSLGLSISFILFARVAMELSYDTFYPNHDRLHFVGTVWDFGKSGKPGINNCIYPVGPTIMEHFPEHVASATVIKSFWPIEFQLGERMFDKDEFIAVDSLFFQTLGIPLLKGNAKDLGMPNVVFMSESFARKVFGNEDPMGKTIIYNGESEALVKGVYKDIPLNNTIRANAVLSISSLNFRRDWLSGGSVSSIIRLKEGANAAYINERINPILKNYLPMEDHYSKNVQVKEIRVSLLPIKGYHLKISNVQTMIYIMSLLGFVLLISAAFNYALIAISTLSHRAKAIGVHKCNGAETGSIFGMFFWETFFIVGLSIILSVFLILNFSEQIEELTATPLTEMFNWKNLWAPILATLLLFIIGCVLPGRLFSSIPVTQVFRRYTEGKKRWKYPLLCMQFGGTAFLLAFVSVVFLQYRYSMNKDLGYNIEGLVYVNHTFPNPHNALSNLRNLPYVEGAENASTHIMDPAQNLAVFKPNGDWMFTPRVHYANENFCKLVGLRLITGRYPSGPGEIAVNPEFVKKIGWTSNGIGEVVQDRGTVTGIVEYTELDRVQTSPYWIHWKDDSEPSLHCVHVRLKEPFDDNLLRLNEDMHRLYPQNKILFQTVESSLADYFRSARIFRNSILIACIIILVITLMGIVGYTNDEVRRRSKEIAIRKINGAEVSTILRMLYRDVSFIAIPSVLVGALASWHVSGIWISTNFVDKLPINPMLFAITFLVVMAFIVGTVIIKSWRIANENPVLSIKSE